MSLPTITLSRAAIWSRLRKCETWKNSAGDTNREIPDDLHEAILAHRCCPNCARFPELHYLMPLNWVDEDCETNAGYECGNCEEFYPTGNLYEYGPDPDEWRGDADPGL